MMSNNKCLYNLQLVDSFFRVSASPRLRVRLHRLQNRYPLSYSCTKLALRSDRFGSIKGCSWARNVIAHIR